MQLLVTSKELESQWCNDGVTYTQCFWEQIFTSVIPEVLLVLIVLNKIAVREKISIRKQQESAFLLLFSKRPHKVHIFVHFPWTSDFVLAKCLGWNVLLAQAEPCASISGILVGCSTYSIEQTTSFQIEVCSSFTAKQVWKWCWNKTKSSRCWFGVIVPRWDVLEPMMLI